MLFLWDKLSERSSPKENSAESSGASQTANVNDSLSGELLLRQFEFPTLLLL